MLEVDALMTNFEFLVPNDCQDEPRRAPKSCCAPLKAPRAIQSYPGSIVTHREGGVRDFWIQLRSAIESTS
jgi:hypothetical protein